MTADNDITSLFETQTIEQIQDDLTKTRNDIEKKKEELRIMVGERYRDLIEAADTIAEMKNSAQSISNHIETVETLCGSLQKQGLIGFKAIQSQPVIDNVRTGVRGELYSIAVQVKILVAVPEILWGLTERQEYLSAAQLYLLSQHTYTVLQLSPQAPKVFTWFPVIERQWSSISQFSSTITRGCISVISFESNVQDVMDAIVAVMLIEGCGSSNALDKMLSLRKEALKTCLFSKPSVTSKTQICEFVTLLLNSFHCIRTVFTGSEDNASALEKKVNMILKWEGGSDSHIRPIDLLHESSLTLSFLPSSIVQFKPRIDENALVLNDKEVQEKVCVWREEVLNAAKQSLHYLLTFTTSIKALAMIRSGVWDITLNTSDYSMTDKVDPWNDVIRSEVINRAKAVIKSQLQSTATSVMTTVQTLLAEISSDSKVCVEEGDITSFVWTESAEDLPDKVGWTSASTRSPSEVGGLFYKTRGYTSRIQTICKSLNSKLVALIEDLSNFAPENIASNVLAPSDLTPEEKMITEDYNLLLQYLQEETQTVFAELVKGFEDEVNGNDNTGNDDLIQGDDKIRGSLNTTSTSIVVLARLCMAMTQMCPYLQICASATLLTQADLTRRMSLGVKVETDSWSSVCSNFQATNTRLMTIFLSSLTSSLTSEMKQELASLLSMGSSDNVLPLYPSWESVNIEEEGEGGETVKSSINIPGQPTPLIILTLTRVCSAINCVALHTLTRNAQNKLVSLIGEKIVEVYESLDTATMNQNIVLQLIFDLKFVQILLIPRDNKLLGERTTKLIEKLEMLVDPFDLDVFSPHITTRVRAVVHRSQVILGILIPRDRQVIGSRNPLAGSSSAANNSLPLVPVVDIPRFSNVPLPVSTSSSSSTRLSSLVTSTASTNSVADVKMLNNKKKDDQISRPPKDMSSAAIAASRSAASLFSAAMSSSWFSSSNT